VAGTATFALTRRREAAKERISPLPLRERGRGRGVIRYQRPGISKRSPDKRSAVRESKTRLIAKNAKKRIDRKKEFSREAAKPRRNETPLSRLRERGRGEGGGDGVIRNQGSEVRNQNVGARFIAPCFASREGTKPRRNKAPSPSRGGLGWGWGYQESEVRGQVSEKHNLTRGRKGTIPSPACGRGVGERA